METVEQESFGPTDGAKFYVQPSISQLGSQTSSQPPIQQQSNQLLRLAALSMMSKLFSAIRSQSNSIDHLGVLLSLS